MPSSSLRLDAGNNARERTAAWLSATLQEWLLPGQLSQGWLPAVERGLSDGAASEVSLDYDSELGLVSVEVRAPDGKVIIGLDDFVGPA